MNKTILVTGASSGIGRAATKVFAQHGWNVIATMPRTASDDELGAIPNVLVAQLDVRDEAMIGRAIELGMSRFGRIDAFLSNAGYGQYGIFEAVPQSKIEAVFAVNVFGAMNVLRSILPEFRKNKGGLVLVTSSSGGIYGLPTMTPYITTKFAIEGFFESVAYELASQNITVKLIEPGGVDTPFHRKADAVTVGSGGIADYAAFYQKVSDAVNAKIDSHSLLSPEDVAKVFYEAATDGSDRLRYVVGKDAAMLIEARVRGSQESFRNIIKSEFGLGV